MAKENIRAEANAIIRAIAQWKEGASLENVNGALNRELSRRTLQRRLSVLVEEGKITKTGNNRGARYFIAETVNLDSEGITLSDAGAQIRRAVRAPIQRRKPVGYNREFLDDYRPNRTAYLSPELRAQLVGYGHTPDEAAPAGTYARQIFGRLLIDLSWNSSRLEGNTYSLLETERLLELGESAHGKSARDAQMILNHKAAIEMLIEEAREIGFNRYTLLNLHGLLADNLLSDPYAGGRLRAIAVGISATVFYPLEVPQLIEECFDQILAKATAIEDPFEQAFFAMVHFPYLQPFEDVNKRVSRLATNIPLIRRNLCPLSFVDVPNQDYIDGVLGVYELNRIELLRDVFVWAYRRSCERYAAIRRSLGQPDPFRLRHRQKLLEVVGAVVRAAQDKQGAARFIFEQSLALPAEERARFVEVAETELQSLHEGNFARYRVRPSEFERWRQGWH